MVDFYSGDSAAARGPDILDGTDASFMKEVVEESKTRPVLVDFWAPWCGPCRALTPTLEKAIKSRGGKVRLVKINVDEHQQYASQLGARSIPFVVAFNDGRPVDAFMGAQPESQVNIFIDKAISGTSEAEAIEKALEAADEAFRNSDFENAMQAYAAVLGADRENIAALAGLARVFLVTGEDDKARQVLDMVPEAKRSDHSIRSVITALELSTEDAPAADELASQIAAVEAAPDDVDTRFALAEALVAARRNGEAVDHLLTLLSRDLTAKDGEAKALLLKVFEAEGPKSKLTVEGRRKLSALMFS